MNKQKVVDIMLEEIRKGDHPILDYATEISLKEMYDSYKKDKYKTIILQDDKKGFIFGVIGALPFNNRHKIGYEIFHFSCNGKKDELIDKFKVWSKSNGAVAFQIGHGIHSRKNKFLSKAYKPRFGDPMGYIYVERI